MKRVILKNLSFSGNRMISSRRLFNIIMISALELNLPIEPYINNLKVSSFIPSKENKIFVPINDIDNFIQKDKIDKKILKVIKKYKYVNLDLINNLENTIINEDMIDDLFIKNNLDSVVHNSISRKGDETKLFNDFKQSYEEINFFYEGEDISNIIKYLKDSNFGPNKSNEGYFEDYKIEEYDNKNSESSILISKLIPNETDINYLRNDSYYNLVEERGLTYYGNKHYKHPKILFVEEGSLINSKIEGRNIELENESIPYKPIVYGKALKIGTNLKIPNIEKKVEKNE